MSSEAKAKVDPLEDDWVQGSNALLPGKSKSMGTKGVEFSGKTGIKN